MTSPPTAKTEQSVELLKQAAVAVARRSPRIAVVGSINLDFIVNVARSPELGETVTGESLEVLPGGKGANQATQAALLGAEVSMVGRVGSTVLAQMAQEGLNSAGVDLTHVSQDPDLETGLAFVFVEESGDNRIVVASRANAALSAEHVEAAREVIAAADVLLLQLEVPDEAIAAAAHIASEAGCKVVLNPAPARPISSDLLSRVSYLLPNETEAASLSGAPDAEEQVVTAAAQELIQQGVSNVIVTLGAQGALALSASESEAVGSASGAAPSEPIHVPAMLVPQVVDPTGAGDAFCAALGVGVAAGLDLADCMALGAIAGGHAVTRTGAQASMGTLAELTAWVEGL